MTVSRCFRIEQMRRAAADLEGALREIARFHNSLGIDHADNDVDGVFLEALQFSKLRDRNELPIDKESVESLTLGPARDIGVKSFSRFDQRREHLERAALRRRLDLFHDRGQTLFFDRQIAVRTKLRSGFRKEQTKKMINLRHRRDGRFAAAAGDALLDRHTRRQTGDKIDIGFFELLDELPRVGRHAVEKSALSFGEQNVERECRFSRAAQSRDHDHLVARNFDVDVLEIVLARAVNADRAVRFVDCETRRRFRCARRAPARHLPDNEIRGEAPRIAREARALPEFDLQKIFRCANSRSSRSAPAFRSPTTSPPSSPLPDQDRQSSRRI